MLLDYRNPPSDKVRRGLRWGTLASPHLSVTNWQEAEWLEDVRKLDVKMMSNRSNLGRASAWRSARLPWAHHGACAHSGEGRGEERRGSALPPPQRPSACKPRPLQLLAFPNNRGRAHPPGALRPLALGLSVSAQPSRVHQSARAFE